MNQSILISILMSFSLVNFIPNLNQNTNTQLEQAYTTSDSTDLESEGSSIYPDFKEWTIDSKQLKNLFVGSYFTGSKNPKVLWLEYLDVECPFCKRFHQDWVLSKLMSKYSGDMVYSIQHFPLSFHENAMSWSVALECIWSMLWSNKFFDYWFSLLSLPLEDKPTYKNLWSIAKKYSINENNFKKCYNSSKFNLKINKQSTQWVNLFNVQWTPANVFINIKTLKWIIVPWAYPIADVEKAVNKILE